jgi:hypothetical protein
LHSPYSLCSLHSPRLVLPLGRQFALPMSGRWMTYARLGWLECGRAASPIVPPISHLVYLPAAFTEYVDWAGQFQTLLLATASLPDCFPPSLPPVAAALHCPAALPAVAGGTSFRHTMHQRARSGLAFLTPSASAPRGSAWDRQGYPEGMICFAKERQSFLPGVSAGCHPWLPASFPGCYRG